MGKSALLARFVLQNAERDPANPDVWRPFVYIDFDRPELDATNLAGVLLAIVRQLGPQVPGIAKAAQALVDGQVQRKRTRGAPAGSEAQAREHRRPGRVRPGGDHPRRRHGPVGGIATDTPIVMILDTLEEVQFSNPDASRRSSRWSGNCRRTCRSCGRFSRAAFSSTRAVTPMELGGLRLPACVALLQNELPAELATNTQLVARLAEIVAVRDKNDKLRGNPLSLRLAAEVDAARSGGRRARDRGAGRGYAGASG